MITVDIPVHPRLCLSNRADPLKDLFVLFAVPAACKIYEDVGPALEIQSVACACRVSKKNRDLSGIPGIERGRLLIKSSSLRKSLAYPVEVRAKVIRHEDGHSG